VRILVTGGAGFIGSALVRYLVAEVGAQVGTIDCLTYAGSLANLHAVAQSEAHTFFEIDICDAPHVRSTIFDFAPDAIIHLAAESHVDRSIDGPGAFIQTNVIGTYNLLESARAYVAERRIEDFRFIHVSTDEVYGSLGPEGAFSEESAYRPNSPYSASKAASDHLARAWHETYRLPVIVTNCSNNYGPHQFPEKLIPLTILNALSGRRIPIYGDGQQVRDWLYVEDHVRGLYEVLQRGHPGKTYNIGGNTERTNLQVVKTILASVARHAQRRSEQLDELIEFVTDRPGHDRRYAIDASRMRTELAWQPRMAFADGIDATVAWYIANEDWCAAVSTKYGRHRLGLARN
jgi:dTDP-glucose 4,6-dehydratase